MQDKRSELEHLLLQRLDEDCYSLTTNEVDDIVEISINGSRQYFADDEDFWPQLILLLESFENLEGISIEIPDLPVGDISGMAKSVRLKRIILNADITLSDLSPLTQLSELKHLSLSKSLVSDLAPLSELTELGFLSLPGGKISDLAPLSRLTQLRFLNLSGSKITDITHLANLVNLQTIYLNGNEVEDISNILALPNLHTIDLSENRLSNLPVEGISPTLRVLRVNHNHLSHFDLGDHPLTELSVSGNPIGDLSALGQLSQLKCLEIAHIKADTAFLSELTKLTTLNAEDCGITDISFITVLSELEYLNLNNNSIGNNFPQTFYYTRLKTLCLQNNGIDASVNKVTFYLLATCFLERLDLRGNEFGGNLYIRDYYNYRETGSEKLSVFRQGIKNYYKGVNDLDGLLTLCYLDEGSTKEQVLFFINKLIKAPRKDYLFRVHYLRKCEVILHKDSPFRNDPDIQMLASIIQRHQERLRKRMGNTKAHHFTFKTALKLWLEVPPAENIVDLHILGEEIFRSDRDASLYLLKKLMALGNPLQYALGQCLDLEISAVGDFYKEVRHSIHNINTVKVPDFDIVDYLVARKKSEKEDGKLFDEHFLGINWKMVVYVILVIITIVRLIKAMS